MIIHYLAATTPLTQEEKAKKIRNLEKKLRQIADIRDKQSRGEKIDTAQVRLIIMRPGFHSIDSIFFSNKN